MSIFNRLTFVNVGAVSYEILGKIPIALTKPVLKCTTFNAQAFFLLQHRLFENTTKNRVVCVLDVRDRVQDYEPLL